MNPIANLIPEIHAFRPFLPAKEFETSLPFYKTIGFEAYPLGPALAELSLGPHAFLLQGYYVREWAENMVMHVLVNDVGAWWQHIDLLKLADQFGVSSPAAARIEPWGLTVAYVFDPSGTVALCRGNEVGRRGTLRLASRGASYRKQTSRHISSAIEGSQPSCYLLMEAIWTNVRLFGPLVAY